MSVREILISDEEIQESCCLCCSVRDGAITTAIVTMAIQGVQLFVAACLLDKSHAEEEDAHILYFADAKLGALICDSVLFILFSIMLCFAVGTLERTYEYNLKYSWLFYPWMIYAMLHIGFSLGGSILFFLYKSNLEGSIAIIGFVVYSYMFISVLRYYQLLFTVVMINSTLELLIEIGEGKKDEEIGELKMDEITDIDTSQLK